MTNNLPLISTIAVSFGFALIGGFLASKLKMPPLIGYLTAGILVGPATPGFVADSNLSFELSEIGVILLMFGVGLHFSIQDLLKVKKIVIPGAIVQITIAALLGVITCKLWGLSLGTGLVFGLSLSVASTVVLLKALEQKNLLNTLNGKIAVGWLIVEDLVMVLVLVLLPAFAPYFTGSANQNINIWQILGLTLGKLGIFIVLMLVIGRKVFPWILWQIAKTNSKELFTLAIICSAIGIAYASSNLFGISFALGAFFAGMVLRESHLSHRALEDSLPLRDAFSILFFVAVGMLFNPSILIDEPLKVLIVVLIIILGKALASFAIVILFKYPLNTALTVSASLAQIGEFSFILLSLGKSLNLIDNEIQNLVLAGAIISITLNHVIFLTIDPIQKFISSKRKLNNWFENSNDKLAVLPDYIKSESIKNHTIIVGYGELGIIIANSLQKNNQKYIVADINRELVENLREKNINAVAGDVIEPNLLIQAHVVRANNLILTLPDNTHIQKIVEIAKMLNPNIQVFIRSNDTLEYKFLIEKNLGTIFDKNHTIASRILDKISLNFNH